MIKEIREKEPFIHFGFNRQTIIARVGIPIRLWQDNLYKDGEYNEPFLLAPSAAVTKISDYEYSLNFFSLGQKNCQISTIGTGAKFLASNVITANVEAITWGATDIFLGNTDLTFNSIFIFNL